jgi:hypothetical protein
VGPSVAAFLPRLIGVVRFRQSLLGAVLHPLGICALVAIQWFVFIRSQRHASGLERALVFPGLRHMKHRLPCVITNSVWVSDLSLPPCPVRLWQRSLPLLW